MRHLTAAIVATTFLCGCGIMGAGFRCDKAAPVLTVRWQRLVDERGQTCERCGSTEGELEEAVARLRRSLGVLGVRVILEKKALSPEVFAKDASASNRILLGDRPLEDWLGATVGKSACESCCPAVGQKVECRTISVGGQTYEGIPAGLIVRAGLLAGAQLVPATSARACCPAPGPGR